MRSPSRRLTVFLLVAAVSLGVTGCATTVAMEPAPDANDPACADVMVRLPDSVAGQDRRWTDAQATAAWDNVLLTCGLAAPGPTVLPCQSVGGVDWLVDDTEVPNYRFTTFGRTPAVEVYLDYDNVSGEQVLSALATAVGTLPTDGLECTDRPAE